MMVANQDTPMTETKQNPSSPIKYSMDTEKTFESVNGHATSQSDVIAACVESKPVEEPTDISPIQEEKFEQVVVPEQNPTDSQPLNTTVTTTDSVAFPPVQETTSAFTPVQQAPTSTFAAVQETPTKSLTTPVETTTPVMPTMSSTVDEAALLQEQFRFCLTLLRHMKKRKDAFPFLTPVDPVLLNIPTYFDVIEKPMDMSTVEKKLLSSTYKTIQEFADDMQLMLDNCYKFNGVEAAVSVLGQNLEKHFKKEMEKLPKELKEKTKKKGPRLMSSPAFGHLDSRPKREVPATPRESLLETLSRSNRKLTPELKFASALLRDLMKKHYAPYNIAFLQPVDPDALGIPQYRDIIKNPMDLSTMRKKMDSGIYNEVSEFVADMRLMFQNCYTFNAPGTEVYNLGKELEAVFDRKWAEKPAPGEPYEEKPRRQSHPVVTYEEADEESTDDDDADAQHIEMLKTQVQLLTTQLTLLTEKRARRKKSKTPGVSKPKKPKVPKPKPLASPAFHKPMKATPVAHKRSFSELDADHVEELTYEQKRELSENINILSQDQLAKVLQIIRENTHIDESQGEEIELDIDSLDKGTLWKLYKYVSKHTQKNKRSKNEGPGLHGMDSSSDSSSGSDSDDSASGSD